jgi:predicted CXXCH cytochrome family protein
VPARVPLAPAGSPRSYRGVRKNRLYAEGAAFDGANVWVPNMVIVGGMVPVVTKLLHARRHDGATAMGSTFKGSTGGVAALAPTSYAFIGTNLADDHPVGVLYTGGALGTTGWKSESAVGGVGLKLYAGQGGLTVECASCHEPHGVSDGATGGTGFLRVAIGELCSGCHTK